MEVGLFLKERTNFIRKHYAVAVTPFEAIKSKIEIGEAPYEPPYSEDGEPPFLEEWLDAETSIQVSGRACIILLSESVKLYFKTWEELLGVNCQSTLRTLFKKQGFVAGYKECFRRVANLDWSECPADMSIIEEIALARNASAHLEGDTFGFKVYYGKREREKIESPLFLHEYEKSALNEDQKAAFSFLGSELSIKEETLGEAIHQVELLVEWLEPKLQDVRWGH